MGNETDHAKCGCDESKEWKRRAHAAELSLKFDRLSPAEIDEYPQDEPEPQVDTDGLLGFTVSAERRTR